MIAKGGAVEGGCPTRRTTGGRHGLSMLPDYEGSIRLIAAVVRLWIRDAGGNPAELAAVAGWLGITPAELRRRLAPVPERNTLPGDMICPMCGGRVVWSGTGRYKIYCDKRCGSRARRQRGKKHAAAR